MKVTEGQVLKALYAHCRSEGTAETVYARLCNDIGSSRWLRIPATWRISFTDVCSDLEYLANKKLITRDRLEQGEPGRLSPNIVYKITQLGVDTVGSFTHVSQFVV